MKTKISMKKCLLVGLMGVGFMISRHICLPVHAQATLTEDQKKKLNDLSAGYSTSSFDLKTISESYLGNDPVALYVNLIASLSPKGEFETTVAYNERMAQAPNQPLIGDLKSNAMFVCQSSPDAWQITYDADSSQFMFKAQLITDSKGFSDVFNSTQNTLELRKIASSDGAYIGQNSYGAQTNIEKMNLSICKLTCQNLNKFPGFLQPKKKKGYRFAPSPEFRFSVPMTLEKAKDAKADLRVLVVFTLSGSKFDFRTSIQTPTLNSPVQQMTNHLFLVGNAQCFVVYNFSTGEIIKTIEPNL